MLQKSIDEPDMTIEEFEMIRDFIHEKSGIHFAENRMYLVKNRLTKRMNELDIKGFKDYFYHVKYDSSMKEFNELMNLITTNETSFFRNEPQLMSFSEELLPALIKKKRESNQNHIKIWSAGCSTGEEPFTLAMMLLEKFQAAPGMKAEIIANDISEQVLRAARKGEYRGTTLRNVSPDFLNRYFVRNGEMYRVCPEVKALVKFSHLNLNEPRKMATQSGFDVIFCRNVMIYFSVEIKKQLVRSYFNSLLPGGYFYIGHAETLHGISKAFKLVYLKNALVYHKDALDSVKTGMAKTADYNAFGRSDTSDSAGGGASRAMDLLKKIKPMSVTK